MDQAARSGAPGPRIELQQRLKLWGGLIRKGRIPVFEKLSGRMWRQNKVEPQSVELEHKVKSVTGTEVKWKPGNGTGVPTEPGAQRTAH